MAEKRSLGAILLASGRITQDDVDRALDYQRTRGGFFGQALVALGVVSRREVDWALASHYDLPFVFPNASAADHDAANMVKPDWALAHLAVPIVRAGDTLTVVVADPLPAAVLAELRASTGCDIEMALAGAQRIRELIHAIYDAAQTPHVDDGAAIGMDELLAEAIDHGAERFGLSIRGGSGVGWWRTRNASRRVPLLEGWETVLSDAIDPPPLERMRSAAEVHDAWPATLALGGDTIPVEVQALAGAGGGELMFRPVLDRSANLAQDAVLPPQLATELRLLWRGGSARVAFGSRTHELARALLPLLPALALGPHVRAAHVNASGEAATAYTLRAVPDDTFGSTVSSYELDVVTIDLPLHEFPVHALLRAAPLTFMLVDEPDERAAPADLGLNWLLTVAGQPGSYSWELRAVHR